MNNKNSPIIPFLKGDEQKAFTLVELIVVITILAILGTIGFLSFQNYNVYARDTIRKSDLGMIARGIKIKQVEGGYAPMPENAVEIYASGTLIGYQGEFTSKIGNRYKLNGDFKDPLDGLNYVYSVDKNLNTFTIGGFLESDETAFSPHLASPKGRGIIGETYAKEGRILTTNGDKFGIILKDGEAINENTGFSGNKLDIMSGSLDSSYELFLDNNETLTGTGLVSMNPISSCKRILELGNKKRKDGGDGIYTINPTGDNPFEVYCDMKNPTISYGKSCKEILEGNSKYQGKNGFYGIKPDGEIKYSNTYCDMTIDGGGWTLIMKINGENKTFEYDSNLWTNNIVYNENKFDYISEDEVKLNSYNNLAFSGILLQMKSLDDIGDDIDSLIIEQEGNSLFDLIKNGGTITTSLGRQKWLDLLENTNVQDDCNDEGINKKYGRYGRTHIGIIFNGEDNCGSPDSLIGFGNSRNHTWGIYPSVGGGVAGASKNALGWIFVR